MIDKQNEVLYPLDSQNMADIGRLEKRQMVIVEEPPLDQLIEAAGTITYIGQAQPFTATDAPFWQIKAIDTSVAGTTKIGWANGNTKFENKWSLRATLTYSGI